MRLAILLMCHEPPGVIAARLSSAFYRSPDVKVYLHHDLGSRHRDRAAFEAAIPAHVQWEWLPDAVRARWGEYALVEATLRLMEAAIGDAAFAADYLLLASGSCRPIRPLASLQAYLRERPDTDFIQAHDISASRWTKGGLERERFEYFFPFNFQTHRWWFERTTALQRLLRVRRRLPAGLKPHFGSQWFCLRRATAAEVAGLLRRPELARFLATTWIPDEFAIQTAVATLRPRAEVAGHGLTYYEFDALGKPLVLEDWHLEHLRRQPFFFARKISPDAQRLEREFDALVAQDESDLRYFADVGHPTPDFERHLAAVRGDPGRRSRVGSFPLALGGPMAGNRRRYYVVVGSSRARVARLIARARAIAAAIDAPILAFPFDRSGPHVAEDRLRWRGFGPGDRQRVRYDPCAVLHELVQVDPRQCIAFGLDLSTWSWVRDFVTIDPNAVIVDCDPPGLTRAQRAAWALRQTGGAHEQWLREPTLEALRHGLPLPQDWFAERRRLGKTRCSFARPTDVGFADDTTWQALTAAAAELGNEDIPPPPAVATAIAPGEE
jgi:hypothetical protein